MAFAGVPLGVISNHSLYYFRKVVCISGAKRPSKARLAEINKTLHTIGGEIMAIPSFV